MKWWWPDMEVPGWRSHKRGTGDCTRPRRRVPQSGTGVPEHWLDRVTMALGAPGGDTVLPWARPGRGRPVVAAVEHAVAFPGPRTGQGSCRPAFGAPAQE